MFSKVAFALLLSASVAFADDQGMVLRTYPIGDIVFQVSDYPFGAPASPPRGSGGGFIGGGGGGGQFSVPDDAGRVGTRVAAQDSGPAITIDALIETIISSVAPDTWEENGQGGGTLNALGRMLIISQTPDVHTEIEELLRMVRADADGRRTVSIDARWLTLSSQELQELTEGDSQNSRPTRVNRETLEVLTRRPTSKRAITNCFSGQLVHVMSGTRKNVVTSFIPVVGDIAGPEAAGRLVQSSQQRSPFRTVQFAGGEGAVQGAEPPQSNVGYQPIVQSEVLGVVLEIRPTVVGAGRAADDGAADDAEQPEVIVDLSSTLQSQGAPSQPEPQTPGRGLMPQIDRVEVNTAHLATTFIMPLDTPVLVGGLSYSPTGAAAGPLDGEEVSQSYLVLEVR